MLILGKKRRNRKHCLNLFPRVYVNLLVYTYLQILIYFWRRNNADADESTGPSKRSRVSACNPAPVTTSEPADVPVAACESDVTTHATHKFDIALYIGKKLSHDEKFELLKNVHTPDANFSYPLSRFGSKKRAFQHRWIARYPGLCWTVHSVSIVCSVMIWSRDSLWSSLFETGRKLQWSLLQEDAKQWWCKCLQSQETRHGMSGSSSRGVTTYSQPLTLHWTGSWTIEGRETFECYIHCWRLFCCVIARILHPGGIEMIVGTKMALTTPGISRLFSRAEGGDVSLQEQLVNATYTSKTIQN